MLFCLPRLSIGGAETYMRFLRWAMPLGSHDPIQKNPRIRFEEQEQRLQFGKRRAGSGREERS